jgi:hypothetical protein
MAKPAAAWSASALASPASRPWRKVRCMQSTPIGPTGAAIATPKANPFNSIAGRTMAGAAGRPETTCRACACSRWP